MWSASEVNRMKVFSHKKYKNYKTTLDIIKTLTFIWRRQMRCRKLLWKLNPTKAITTRTSDTVATMDNANSRT